MESRLESLLNKFESLLNRMDGNAASSQPSGSSVQASSNLKVASHIKDFDSSVLSAAKKFEDCGKAMQNDVITSIVDNIPNNNIIDYIIPQLHLCLERHPYHNARMR
jgi:hypothetical protein